MSVLKSKLKKIPFQLTLVNFIRQAVLSPYYLMLIFLIVFLFSSCTGLNFRSWPIPVSPNMHPTESYAGGGVFFKGGYIYHKDISILYTGSGKLERTGKACSQSFLYLIAIGSSRIYDAKVNAAVNEIGLIEEEILGILGGVYHRHCTIVSGDWK